mgnify:CR=1 FL=1
MTKNIDNNEIETLEGVYTQTTETEHQEENYSQPNKEKFSKTTYYRGIGCCCDWWGRFICI